MLFQQNVVCDNVFGPQAGFDADSVASETSAGSAHQQDQSNQKQERFIISNVVLTFRQCHPLEPKKRPKPPVSSMRKTESVKISIALTPADRRQLFLFPRFYSDAFPKKMEQKKVDVYFDFCTRLPFQVHAHDGPLQFITTFSEKIICITV